MITCIYLFLGRMEDKANGSVDSKRYPFITEYMNMYNVRINLSPCPHSPVENGQLPDPANWGVADVVNYFKATGFEEQASAFQDQVRMLFLLRNPDENTQIWNISISAWQEIDGKSLLLMTRNDVLTGLSIKLGPALKIYEYHVKPLQTQHLKSNAA